MAQMEQFQSAETIVKEGIFLYDGIVECNIRVVQSPIRYGTGDYDDEPAISNDMRVDTFYILYGSTTEKNKYNAKGGPYDSLCEAIFAAENSAGFGKSIRWSV